jgi:CBS domain-containing protein
MSGGVFGVAEEDSWVTVADMFREKHVRRLPVLRDGKLVGIITRHDLMHAIRDARQRIRQKLAQEACRASRPASDEPIAADEGGRG